MILTLMNRMIFWELVKVFLLSLIGLTGLFMTGGLVQQASQLGLTFEQVLRVIPMMIVISFPYTIPATTLFASCVTYGRLSGDNEAVALKAAGVDLLTVLRPVLLLGVITSGLTIYLTIKVIPTAQQKIQEEVLRDPEEVMYNWLRRERRLVGSSAQYSVYVRDVQGRRLIDVVVKRKSNVSVVPGLGPRFEYDYIARTREARLIVDLDDRTLTIDAERWTVSSPNSAIETEGSRPEKIPLPEMFNAKFIKARPMTLESHELLARAAELQNEIAKLSQVRDEAQRAAERDTNPENAEKHKLNVLHHSNLIKLSEQQLRSVYYEYHSRPALALGCLIFAVVGCPVGLWFSRSDYLSITVVCFLPMIAIYYPILLAGGGVARDGKVPMLVGVWAANVICGLLALVLINRLIKR